MWNIKEFDSVGSTNALAKEELAENLARHGDVYQAQHQTSGRGRIADRKWSDEAGSSLLMSIVLERLPVPRVELIQYLVALSVVTAFRDILVHVGKPASLIRLKWPNDILLGDRKICGILSEGIWQSQFLKGIIVGIGANITQESFSGQLESKATSFHIADIPVSVSGARDILLDTLWTELDRYEALPGHVVQMSIIGSMRKELEWMKVLPPMTVTIQDGSGLNGMQYAGITDEGALLLRHADGTEHILTAGSLEWSQEIREAMHKLEVSHKPELNSEMEDKR